jgi:putative restriction endonuclease
MKLWAGVTDNNWYKFLSEGNYDEVNFWQPSGRAPFTNLPAGTPFLFKLKAPNNHIAGGGYFVNFSTLPLPMAWEAFGPKNGSASFTTAGTPTTEPCVDLPLLLHNHAQLLQ